MGSSDKYVCVSQRKVQSVSLRNQAPELAPELGHQRLVMGRGFPQGRHLLEFYGLFVSHLIVFVHINVPRDGACILSCCVTAVPTKL